MGSHSKIRCGIVSTGAALPEKKLTNADLEKIVETNNEWIVTRTGIRERRIAEAGTGSSHLAVEACREALQRGGVDPREVDLVILATVTPDQPVPATANMVQARLGASRAAAFDLNAGCSGFVYAVGVARQFIENGMYRNVLVVGVDLLTRITDWQDRSTCVLFGDGAAAVLLQPVEEGGGILAMEMGSDGNGADFLKVPAGGSLMPSSHDTVKDRLHYIQMNGNEIFKFAVRIVSETTLNLLKQARRDPSEIRYLFLHQANLRIMDTARKRLGLAPERVPVNIDRYGNMSAATIPVALHETAASGKLKRGDLVALVAFGAGLTWGGVLLEW